MGNSSLILNSSTKSQKTKKSGGLYEYKGEKTKDFKSVTYLEQLSSKDFKLK